LEKSSEENYREFEKEGNNSGLNSKLSEIKSVLDKKSRLEANRLMQDELNRDEVMIHINSYNRELAAVKQFMEEVSAILQVSKNRNLE